MKILLTIAGFDATAGAGILRDFTVFKDLDYYPMAVPTCNTAQNTMKFLGSEPANLEIFANALELIDEEVTIDGIKIGMIPSYNHAEIIYDYIEHKEIPIIYDPVGKTTTGGGESSDWNKMVNLLSKKTSLITPNREELEALGGQLPCPILVTGVEKGLDQLILDNKEVSFCSEQVPVREHHGTGCTLSSAILSYLVETGDLIEAIEQAKDYMVKKLKENSPLGKAQALFL